MRIFVYDGREFPDPDPNLTVDQVRQHMANYFPELSNATSSENKEGENTVITLTKRVGTKGVRMAKCSECPKRFECNDPASCHIARVEIQALLDTLVGKGLVTEEEEDYSLSPAGFEQLNIHLN